MQTTRPIAPATVLAAFKALSDPLRLQVVELLREREMCVCDLCDRLSVSQSKLSFHLKILRQASLLTARQEGRWIYYSLNGPGFVGLEQYLTEVGQLSAALPARACSPGD
ncbi:MAG: ArsR/SmtB family transcription factor [Nodosilinea sp.]